MIETDNATIQDKERIGPAAAHLCRRRPARKTPAAPSQTAKQFVILRIAVDAPLCFGPAQQSCTLADLCKCNTPAGVWCLAVPRRLLAVPPAALLVAPCRSLSSVSGVERTSTQISCCVACSALHGGILELIPLLQRGGEGSNLMGGRHCPLEVSLHLHRPAQLDCGVSNDKMVQEVGR